MFKPGVNKPRKPQSQSTKEPYKTRFQENIQNLPNVSIITSRGISFWKVNGETMTLVYANCKLKWALQREIIHNSLQTWTDSDGPSWIQYDLFRKNKLPRSKNVNLAKFMLRAVRVHYFIAHTNKNTTQFTKVDP